MPCILTQPKRMENKKEIQFIWAHRLLFIYRYKNLQKIHTEVKISVHKLFVEVIACTVEYIRHITFKWRNTVYF